VVREQFCPRENPGKGGSTTGLSQCAAAPELGRPTYCLCNIERDAWMDSQCAEVLEFMLLQRPPEKVVSEIAELLRIRGNDVNLKLIASNVLGELSIVG